MTFLVAAALAGMVSAAERRLWGTMRTPFALVAYPGLAALLFAMTAGVALDFVRPRPTTALTVIGSALIFGGAGLAVRYSWKGRRRPIAFRAGRWKGEGGGSVGNVYVPWWEWLLVSVVLALAVGPVVLRGGADEPLASGWQAHVANVGKAYALLAAIQGRGALLPRALVIAVVALILLANGVKYHVLLLLAGILAWHFVRTRPALWKLGLVAVILPGPIVLASYRVSDVVTADGFAERWEAAKPWAIHASSYVVAGTLGYDAIIASGVVPVFREEGVAWALAPVVNAWTRLSGAREMVSPVAELWVPTQEHGRYASNVFTLPGSVFLHSGWILGAALLGLYGVVSYIAWRGVLSACNPPAGAMGAWWLGALALAWHDAFIIHFSFYEVLLALWFRGRGMPSVLEWLWVESQGGRLRGYGWRRALQERPPGGKTGRSPELGGPATIVDHAARERWPVRRALGRGVPAR